MTFCQRHAYGFGVGLARLLSPFFGKRLKIARENLLRCGITSDPREAKRLAQASLGHFVGHICEALFVAGVVTRENWREHLDFSQVDPETAHLLLEETGLPILLVSSHHGVWEAGANVLSMVRPIFALARLQKSKLLEKWMRKHHFRGSVTIISKNHGFTKEILARWEHEAAALTILMDQFHYRGELVEFLGRPARTHTSAARLAIRTGHPVVIGSFVRVSPYRYALVGGPPLRFRRGDDLKAAVQLLNDRLAEPIRRYPEQYLWIHRRWRDD